MSDDHSRIARLETSLESILRTLDEMKGDARRREEKIDSLAAGYVEFKHHRTDICQPLRRRIDGLEVRIRALEAFKWKALGAVAVVSFLANILANRL